MRDWRTLKVGDKVTFTSEDFDGTTTIEAVITEVHDDHVIANADDMNLWIDDDTEYQFN